MAKQKFYVIWVGRSTGIFYDWPTVQGLVSGYPGARHRSFTTLAQARAAFAEAPANPSPASKSKINTNTTNQSVLTSSSIPDSAFDINIFCDGGCDPNPGNAASGVVVYQAGKLSAMYHGLYNPHGTNNTAELNALHQAMLIAQGKLNDGLTVQILSDSIYCVKSMTQWGAGWKRSGRMAGRGKPLANVELITEMFELYSEIGSGIKIVHVMAHSGIEGNELADRLCTLAIAEKVREFVEYDDLDVEQLLAL